MADTTLAADQDELDLTLTLAAALAEVGDDREILIQIDAELELVERRGSTTTPQVRRGMFGTFVAEHEAPVDVKIVTPQVRQGDEATEPPPSGEPAIHRYEVTLTAAHFPVGDEEYEVTVTGPAGLYLATVIELDEDFDGDAPDVDFTHPTLTITGAGDPAGAATEGTVTVAVVIATPQDTVTLAAPEEPV